MKTLAELKRAMAVGTHWRARWSDNPDVWKGREVAHVQSNAVAFIRGEIVNQLLSDEPNVGTSVAEHYKTKCRTNPHGSASWHWWDKSSQYRFNADGSVRVYIGGDGDESYWMEYAPVAQGEAA